MLSIYIRLYTYVMLRIENTTIAALVSTPLAVPVTGFACVRFSLRAQDVCVRPFHALYHRPCTPPPHQRPHLAKLCHKNYMRLKSVT
jgi:hypothetical protein